MIQFTDTADGGTRDTLGAGGHSSAPPVRNPAHTYAAAGNYAVKLTASNAGGSSSPTIRTVTVRSEERRVGKESSCRTQAAPRQLQMQLSDPSTGSPTGRQSDFRDHSTAPT